MLELVSSEELARLMGYKGATNAFREWCAKMGIRPVPWRRGLYDLKLVRQRLDEVQGIPDVKQRDDGPVSLVERRRMRRGEI